jgi:hypothetical protein
MLETDHCRLVDFKDAIQSCFSAESVDECIKKLETMSNDQASSTHEWAKNTLAEVKKVDKELLQVLNFNIMMLIALCFT